MKGATKSTGGIRRTRRRGRPAHPAMSPEQRLAHAEEIIEGEGSICHPIYLPGLVAVIIQRFSM